MEPKLFAHLVSIRREIHENPELGYCEFETAALICRELDVLGIPYRSGISKTGIIASLKKGNGPTIVLRADMDALPIKEDTELDFVSTKIAKDYNGNEVPIMHACGHDIHTTILLGAATLLKDKKFNGTIKFVFQPSEEGVNGDRQQKSGGQRIVEAGELDNAIAALGLHVHPELPVGKMAFVHGQALANVNSFTIKILGESAHAGMEPEKGKDAIMVAVELIQQAQLIVTRLISQTEPVVISFTQINGGVNHNILADKITIKGTIRALDLKTYELVIEKFKKLIRGLKSIYGVKIVMKIDLYYPSLLNDMSIHKKLVENLNGVFGNENIIEAKPILGGEDFAFYSRKVPAMFYFLRARDKSEKIYSLHHPKVVFNENCIPYGINLLAESAVKLLQ